MSYDIFLLDPTTKKAIVFEEKHQYGGGTQQLGGTTEAWLNITYNYAEHYYAAIDPELGIRWLYGKTGAEATPKLREAISQLGVDQDADYWKPTPGNAGNALLGLLWFAEQRPDGVFDGD